MSEEMFEKTVSRRDFLKIAGVAGASIGVAGGLGGVLAACGGTEESTTTTAAATTTTGAASTDTTMAGETTTSVSTEAEMGAEVKLGFVTPLTGGLASFGRPGQLLRGQVEGLHRLMASSAATARSTPSPSTCRTASPTPTAPRRWPAT